MAVAGGSRAGRASQIAALGSLKVPGTWENAGTVGMGQERCGKLSVHRKVLLLPPVSALEHQGGAGHAEFSVSVKDSSEVGDTHPTQGCLQQERDCELGKMATECWVPHQRSVRSLKGGGLALNFRCL